MQFDELRFLAQQAAIDVVGRRGRPIAPTLVLPGPSRTSLLALTDLPDADEDRHAVLADVAADRITGAGVPCWGFVAEADVAGHDGVLVVYGARRHAPEVTAALYAADGTLETFLPAEPLDPTAMPFLHPLQHAVDALPGVGDAFAELDPKRAAGPGDLPIHP